MDFSEYKFVVSTGCSYGRLADYTFNWFEHNPNYLKLIDEYGQKDWLDLEDNKIISIDVKEGDLLTFPANFLHRSKKIKNKNYKKTIISFNSSFH